MEGNSTYYLIWSGFVCLVLAFTPTKETSTVLKKDCKDPVDSLRSFRAATGFLDAAVSSLNAFQSLVQKENYRTRIAALNNPASSDMGFSLQNEVQQALKPLLAKARQTNTTKFSQVVNTLMATPAIGLSRLSGFSPAFPSLIGLVSNLALTEKRITKDDLDSFITSISRYFVQYEKLHQANLLFDENMERLTEKVIELQFDLKEYMMDLVLVIHPGLQRKSLQLLPAEELLLKYLDAMGIEPQVKSLPSFPVFPSDGIKTAKEISAGLQKLFAEYQKIYAENYQLIRTILGESKSLGKNIDVRRLESLLKELERLYQDSRSSDAMGLRLNTLAERLKLLTASEQFRD